MKGVIFRVVLLILAAILFSLRLFFENLNLDIFLNTAITIIPIIMTISLINERFTTK